MDKFKTWKIQNIECINPKYLSEVNELINSKKLDKKEICLILNTLKISDYMSIPSKPISTNIFDFKKDWLVEHLKKNKYLKKEYWAWKLGLSKPKCED